MENFLSEEIVPALEEELDMLGEIDSETIRANKESILGSLNLAPSIINTLLAKLNNYRYIIEPDEITVGRYVRWIRIDNPSRIKLTTGGIVVELKDDGEIIVCKNNANRMFQIRFDRSLVFQKLTEGEELIRLMTDYAKS